MKRSLLCVLFVLLVLVRGNSGATTYYVKPPPAGNDANSGLSWTLAKGSPAGALAVAGAGDAIWVAAGTYPGHIRNRTSNGNSIDVKLYGGFRGDETQLDKRDRLKYVTTLDGGGGEPPMPPESGSVITIGGGAGPGMVVDGFTITGGHAYLGGGISMVGSAPTITNNRITDNMAHVGGAIFCSDYKVTAPVAHALISGNLISQNYAGDGGAIAVQGSDAIVPLPSAAPVISNNLISANTADYKAGAIGSWGHASPVIAGNRIRANVANYDESSGSLGGGGIYSTADDLSGEPVQFAIAAPTIVNNLIAANGANRGGGICLIDYRPAPDPHLTPPPRIINNSIVANNGDGIYWDNAFPVISNNLVANNSRGLQQGTLGTSSPLIRHNCVHGNSLQGKGTDYRGVADQTGTNGNISADPRLANAPVGDYHLLGSSPCINAGLSSDAVAGWGDLDGHARLAGAAVDMGAYEWDGIRPAVATPVYRVSPSGSDGDGLSWATAKRTLKGGIDLAAVTGGELWVAAGSYHEHIRIPAYVYLYGGFAGNETVRDARSPRDHPAIIDGDGQPGVVYSTNSGYLVSALDGFTVQNGGTYSGGNLTLIMGTPSFGVGGRGGGVVSRVSSLYLENCTIRRNSLGNPFDNANKLAHGGGFFGYLSHAVVRGNSFVENELLNTFDGSGGGMYLTSSQPIIDGNSFSGNQARSGAAIYAIMSEPRITRNSINGNSFYSSHPLPVFFGAANGAVTLEMGSGFLVEGNLISGNRAATGAGIAVVMNAAGGIRNNLIVGNTAATPESGMNNGMGGGIYCSVASTASENLAIVNNTIAGNSAGAMAGIGELGGGIAISAPPPLPPPATPPPARLLLGNNIIAFNSSGIFQYPTTPMLVPTLTANDLHNSGANYVRLSPGASDLTLDPLFVDRGDGDYRLQAGSPCVDAGGSGLVAAGSFDYAGLPRIVDGKLTGTPRVDLGALELMASHTLNLTIGGSGRGSVIMTPPPTACSVSCAPVFASDAAISLHAVPDQYSLFGGWSGGCGGTADCTLWLLSTTGVGALFTLDAAHAVLGAGGVYHSSLQAAYDAALPGSVVKAWGIEFMEDLVCGQAKTVNLRGGWNSGYTASGGQTLLHGTLRVVRGSLAVENLAIR